MTKRNGGNPTLADVAKRAGVSKMTVSNVVNGRVNVVRDRTVQRVNRAIQKLGYRPHMHARALRLARGWAIGLLVVTHTSDFLASSWMSRVVTGLSTHLNEHGFGLLLHNQGADGLDRSIFVKWANTDGLIAMLSGSTREREAIMDKLSKLNQPVIGLQETIAPLERDMAIVNQDDFEAGRKLAAHLTLMGAKELVFIEPDLAWPAMGERMRGISSVIRHTPGASLRLVKCTDDTYEAVETTVLEDLKEHGLPDAFLGGNESIALATLSTLENAGYRVPHDIFVTGFNAFEFFARRKITTINFPAYELGVRAAQIMLDRLSTGRFSKKIEILPAELVVGETTSTRSPG